VPRSPSEHLTFLLNAHVKTFAELGILDPNGDDDEEWYGGEDEDEGEETDPLLGLASSSRGSGGKGKRACFGWVRWCLCGVF
jgi:hypothetical protein